jgi:hypothetical protein
MDRSHFYGKIIGGYNQMITLLSGKRVGPSQQVTNTPDIVSIILW